MHILICPLIYIRVSLFFQMLPYHR